MKLLSLFSGVGAPEMALRNLNIKYDLVGFSEIDKHAIKSYCAIHGVSEDLNLGDISKIDINILPKDIDLITHGSPCQDFSVAGKGQGGTEGSGTRSSLMWETVKIIRHCKPTVVLWENVKNVVSKKHRPTFDKYLESMENLGYKNYWKVLNAKDYGVPQNRERVFVVSILDNKNFKFIDPIELTSSLKDVLETQVDEKYYIDINNISNFVEKVENFEGNSDVISSDYRYDEGLRIRKNGLCPTLTCKVGSSSLSSNPFIIFKGDECLK